MNFFAPGSSSVVDFGQAAKCFYDGDNVNGLINTASGVLGLVSFGAASTAKEAMKETAKGAVVQTAKEAAKSAGKEATKKVGKDLSKLLAVGAIKGGKEAAIQTAKETAKTAEKEATRKVGQELSKQLAMGAVKGGKEAAIQTAKETARTAKKEATRRVGHELSKQLATGAIKGGKEAAIQTAKETARMAKIEATKKVGQQVAKEIAGGVVTEAVEEVWHEGNEMTFNKMGAAAFLAALSSGELEDAAEVVLISGMEKAFSETVKQGYEKVVFELTKNAAKTAAEEEFKKNSQRLFAKDVIVAAAKGIIKRSGNDDEDVNPKVLSEDDEDNEK